MIGSEPVEVVDAAGVVERVVSRAEMRRERLRHRCTYVVVIDAAERVVVHQRVDWKDVWPNRWDLAFGGVAGVGERWGDAARRELREEAGVDAPLALVAAGTYEDGDVALVGQVYLARSDDRCTFPDGEVVRTERVPVVEVLPWIVGRPHCPDSVSLAAPTLRALARRTDADR